VSRLRAECPDCLAYTVVAIGPSYECHSSGARGPPGSWASPARGVTTARRWRRAVPRPYATATCLRTVWGFQHSVPPGNSACWARRPRFLAPTGSGGRQPGAHARSHRRQPRTKPLWSPVVATAQHRRGERQDPKKPHRYAVRPARRSSRKRVLHTCHAGGPFRGQPFRSASCSRSPSSATNSA
jgi:hypothetical protein